MIYLAQTDSTAGFLSESLEELNAAKGRDIATPCIKTMDSFYKLKALTRVPLAHKNRVRRAKKSSFILSNKKSFRVVKDHPHASFLKGFAFLYSSSANAHGQGFCPEWAKSKADIIINEELYEAKPSAIFKLSALRIRRLRA